VRKTSWNAIIYWKVSRSTGCWVSNVNQTSGNECIVVTGPGAVLRCDVVGVLAIVKVSIGANESEIRLL
jgi:hypothetical protein